METKHYILIGLMIWNLTVFFLYAMDKHRAKSGGWRVPERTLIVCAFCLGGIGAAAGMGVLRHKTRHLRFRLLIPVALVVTGAVVVCVLWPEVVAGVIGAIVG